MKTYLRIALTLGVQLALLGSVAAKYQFDRSNDPHVLIKVVPVDPDSPIKGRYLTLRVEAPAASSRTGAHIPVEVSLSAYQGRLEVTESPGSGQYAAIETCATGSCWVLRQPLEFYVPEHASSPGHNVRLWVEATLPRKGPPRPVGLMRDDGEGHYTPLELN